MNTTHFSQSLRRLSRSRQCLCYSTSSSSDNATGEKLRVLLRETAQSVAVVTSLMPPSENGGSHKFHGATLSSFTAIAMEPYPIVTFALRLPSRMATALSTTQPQSSSHMVVNLLSADQASLAVAFSRPDLHSNPFSMVPYTLSEEGLPILQGSLGALSCKLVAPPIPLHDLEFLRTLGSSEHGGCCRPTQPHHGVTSELFVARVARVENVSSKDGEHDRNRTLPLLYHRRGYTSCQNLHQYTKSTPPKS